MVPKEIIRPAAWPAAIPKLRLNCNASRPISFPAAAAGKLMGLDALQLRRSFGIAAGHAAGLMISFGTMCKAQNSANAAQNAVLSTLLAKQGFTGPEEIF